MLCIQLIFIFLRASSAFDDGTDLVQVQLHGPGEQAANSPAKLAAESDELKTLSVSSTSSEAGARNMCIDGRIAPEFLLIGAQKAATTTFADVIAGSPTIVSPERSDDEPEFYNKELHIFDDHERFQMGQSFWLGRYPACRRDVRLIGTDSTPNYFHDELAPARIMERYGSQARALQFMVLLRDPAKRMQSAYYHGTLDLWYQDVPPTFKEFVSELVLSNGSASDWKDHPQEGSQYVAALQRYFNVFNPAQFIIAPYKYTNDIEPYNIYKYVSIKLGSEPPSDFKTDSPILNTHEHAPIEEDLGSDLLARLDAWFEEHGGAHAVANLLASHPAVDLFAYEGSRSSADSIAEWLTTHW